jgi:predicted metalloprotease with PDZ domain
MSMMAPYVDAATSIDRTSFTNTFISYYTWGAALGLALDLTLRQRFPGVTMDDFMREMWRTHGKTERSYTNADARAALGRVAKDTAFAGWFWRSYVDGREVPDYAALLAQAGVVARQAAPDVAWIGDPLVQLQGDRVVINSSTEAGQPIYEAGLDRGDFINTVDGQKVATVADLERIVRAKKPGDVIKVGFESRGESQEATITLRASPRLEFVTFEAAGREVTDAIRAFRASWVGSKAN